MQEAQTAHHLVTIYVNDRAVQLEAGKYTGAELKQKGGVPAGDILYRVTGSTRHEVGDNESVEVHEGEQFIAVPAHGGAG